MNLSTRLGYAKFGDRYVAALRENPVTTDLRPFTLDQVKNMFKQSFYFLPNEIAEDLAIRAKIKADMVPFVSFVGGAGQPAEDPSPFGFAANPFMNQTFGNAEEAKTPEKAPPSPFNGVSPVKKDNRDKSPSASAVPTSNNSFTAPITGKKGLVSSIKDMFTKPSVEPTVNKNQDFWNKVQSVNNGLKDMAVTPVVVSTSTKKNNGDGEGGGGGGASGYGSGNVGAGGMEKMPTGFYTPTQVSKKIAFEEDKMDIENDYNDDEKLRIKVTEKKTLNMDAQTGSALFNTYCVGIKALAVFGPTYTDKNPSKNWGKGKHLKAFGPEVVQAATTFALNPTQLDYQTGLVGQYMSMFNKPSIDLFTGPDLLDLGAKLLKAYMPEIDDPQNYDDVLLMAIGVGSLINAKTLELATMNSQAATKAEVIKSPSYASKISKAFKDVKIPTIFGKSLQTYQPSTEVNAQIQTTGPSSFGTKVLGGAFSKVSNKQAYIDKYKQGKAKLKEYGEYLPDMPSGKAVVKGAVSAGHFVFDNTAGKLYENIIQPNIPDKSTYEKAKTATKTSGQVIAELYNQSGGISAAASTVGGAIAGTWNKGGEVLGYAGDVAVGTWNKGGAALNYAGDVAVGTWNKGGSALNYAGESLSPYIPKVEKSMKELAEGISKSPQKIKHAYTSLKTGIGKRMPTLPSWDIKKLIDLLPDPDTQRKYKDYQEFAAVNYTKKLGPDFMKNLAAKREERYRRTVGNLDIDLSANTIKENYQAGLKATEQNIDVDAGLPIAPKIQETVVGKARKRKRFISSYYKTIDKNKQVRLQRKMEAMDLANKAVNKVAQDIVTNSGGDGASLESSFKNQVVDNMTAEAAAEIIESKADIIEKLFKAQLVNQSEYDARYQLGMSNNVKEKIESVITNSTLQEKVVDVTPDDDPDTQSNNKKEELVKTLQVTLLVYMIEMGLVVYNNAMEELKQRTTEELNQFQAEAVGYQMNQGMGITASY